MRQLIYSMQFKGQASPVSGSSGVLKATTRASSSSSTPTRRMGKRWRKSSIHSRVTLCRVCSRLGAGIACGGSTAACASMNEGPVTGSKGLGVVDQATSGSGLPRAIRPSSFRAAKCCARHLPRQVLRTATIPAILAGCTAHRRCHQFGGVGHHVSCV